MLARSVLEVVSALSDAGCRAWIAGGWGVDALAGQQTREHRDLDLALDASGEEAALQALAALGYVIETDWRPARVELAAPGERWVDLHPVVFDASGTAARPISTAATSTIRPAASPPAASAAGPSRASRRRSSCASAGATSCAPSTTTTWRSSGSMHAMSQPIRDELLDVVFADPVTVAHSHLSRIELAPGMEAGLHRHPCDVVGCVLSGVIRFQVADEPETRLEAGDAFHEPRGVEIPHFDNASDAEPAVFLACYLLAPGEDQLIEML